MLLPAGEFFYFSNDAEYLFDGDAVQLVHLGTLYPNHFHYYRGHEILLRVRLAPNLMNNCFYRQVTIIEIYFKNHF